MKNMFYHLLGFLVLSTTAVFGDELHIAVAANFTKPAKQLKPLFESQTGHHLILSFGSTGQLYAQIKNGAPYEVFLAADIKRPQKLIDEGNAVTNSLLTYAIGQLVLWSQHPYLIDKSGEILKKGTFKHLAIANPKIAPYGTAAQQVLKRKGLWPPLQGKIVQGHSIVQTYQFIATGNAELGFIALSQYKENPSGSSWLVEPHLYDPIEQGAVLLTKAQYKIAAQAFIQFLQKNASARSIIERFGYRIPPQ